MSKYLFVALTNPKQGKEEEYNEWYSDRHVPEIVSVPGVVSGQRYRAAVNFGPGEPKWRYAAVYEVEMDDPAALRDEIMRRVENQEISLSDASDQDALVVIYDPIGEMTRKGG